MKSAKILILLAALISQYVLINAGDDKSKEPVKRYGLSIRRLVKSGLNLAICAGSGYLAWESYNYAQNTSNQPFVRKLIEKIHRAYLNFNNIKRDNILPKPLAKVASALDDVMGEPNPDKDERQCIAYILAGISGLIALDSGLRLIDTLTSGNLVEIKISKQS